MSNNKLWKTKDGQKIRIKNLEDSHLLNIITMLKRNHSRIKHEACSIYPSFQGEMAQYYAEKEWDQMMESDPSDCFPIFDDLMEEVIKRKLTKEN